MKNQKKLRNLVLMENIKIKFSKDKRLKELLNISRRKATCYEQGKPHKTIKRFTVENLEARKEWHDKF